MPNMQFLSVTVLLALGSIAFGIPTQNHVSHERRDGVSNTLNKRGPVQDEHILPLRIGLTQRNLHMGDQWLNEV